MSDQNNAPEGQMPEQCPVCSGKSFAKIDGEQARRRCVECKTVTPQPAAPTDNTALVEAAAKIAENVAQSYDDQKSKPGRNEYLLDQKADTARRIARDIRAALASREAPPAAQEPKAMRCAECDCENGGKDCNWIAPPPASQQEAVAVAEAAQKVSDLWGNGCHDISWRGHFDGAMTNLKAALRALKGGS